MVRATARTALRLSEKFGFKISGEYLKGEEWRMRDPAEPPRCRSPAVRRFRDSSLALQREDRLPRFRPG
jgi:hypothetical protein